MAIGKIKDYNYFDITEIDLSTVNGQVDKNSKKIQKK